MTGRLTCHWRPESSSWLVLDSDLGFLKAFDTLHDAECWVLAEHERREHEAQS